MSSCFSSRRRHTRLQGDWSSDVCSSDLALGEFPLPDVAVLDEADQAGHGLVGLEELPGQARAGLVHVEVHDAASALVAAQLFGSALVVVQHHELGNARLDLGHELGDRKSTRLN